MNEFLQSYVAALRCRCKAVVTTAHTLIGPGHIVCKCGECGCKWQVLSLRRADNGTWVDAEAEQH